MKYSGGHANASQYDGRSLTMAPESTRSLKGSASPPERSSPRIVEHILPRRSASARTVPRSRAMGPVGVYSDTSEWTKKGRPHARPLRDHADHARHAPAETRPSSRRADPKDLAGRGVRAQRRQHPALAVPGDQRS